MHALTKKNDFDMGSLRHTFLTKQDQKKKPEDIVDDEYILYWRIFPEYFS